MKSVEETFSASIYPAQEEDLRPGAISEAGNRSVDCRRAGKESREGRFSRNFKGVINTELYRRVQNILRGGSRRLNATHTRVDFPTKVATMANDTLKNPLNGLTKSMSPNREKVPESRPYVDISATGISIKPPPKSRAIMLKERLQQQKEAVPLLMSMDSISMSGRRGKNAHVRTRTIENVGRTLAAGRLPAARAVRQSRTKAHQTLQASEYFRSLMNDPTVTTRPAKRPANLRAYADTLSKRTTKDEARRSANYRKALNESACGNRKPEAYEQSGSHYRSYIQ